MYFKMKKSLLWVLESNSVIVLHVYRQSLSRRGKKESDVKDIHKDASLVKFTLVIINWK